MLTRIGRTNLGMRAIMYHYVRDVEAGRFRGLKALSTSDFLAQLDWIDQNYTVVSVDLLAEVWPEVSLLPQNACFLTFDDGLREHATFVTPELERRGWSGAFYASHDSVVLGKILDVHKIHLLLSEVRPDLLAAALKSQLDMVTHEEMREAHYRADEYDVPDTVFVKRCLNFGLPDGLRGTVLDSLFSRYISEDEASIANELYFDLEMARAMKSAGMCFGGHGKTHAYMPTATDKRGEVEGAVALLDALGAAHRHYVYPFLSPNSETFDLLSEHGFALAFSAGSRELSPCDEKWLLPRFDTIELPPINRALLPWRGNVNESQATLPTENLCSKGGK